MKRRSFIGLATVFLASCTAATQQPNASSPGKTTGSQPPLKLAITDVQGLDNLKRDYEAFRNTLSSVLERPIEFYPVDGYLEAASALQSGKVDLALTGPSEYVVIQARTNAIPIIAITRPNYHPAIAVSASSPLKTVADLKGKTVAMLKVGSTSGHLGPTKMLMDAGLNPKTDYQVKMLGREGSLNALKAGEVDAWGGPVIDYQQFLEQDDIAADEFRLLKKGPSLPNDVLVVNSNSDMDLMMQLRDRMIVEQKALITALASAPANAKYKESTLVSVEDSDYNMIREVYQAIGEGNFL
ncbi:PhnD/SsuA/transferrin family substrate-binding protein [Spirulina sp. CS-785/01]|uniref:PhnD/SsuA/transferrin family substrate-binding protein n=1 Tax=Spirulina sp. CS-785/01 TaxID=3021716 RepID=UPI00232BA887|nr:PhnD/SsuA/transferrin family substrate-binding protein [Spirulina sp. CS-785/01]MDB9314459.1 PhnD/SsuA/transferrin family substrate-binding protein [Spirulina sp. CS-785/01]